MYANNFQSKTQKKSLFVMNTKSEEILKQVLKSQKVHTEYWSSFTKNPNNDIVLFVLMLFVFSDGFGKGSSFTLCEYFKGISCSNECDGELSLVELNTSLFGDIKDK